MHIKHNIIVISHGQLSPQGLIGTNVLRLVLCKLATGRGLVFKRSLPAGRAGDDPVPHGLGVSVGATVALVELVGVCILRAVSRGRFCREAAVGHGRIASKLCAG